VDLEVAEADVDVVPLQVAEEDVELDRLAVVAVTVVAVTDVAVVVDEPLADVMVDVDEAVVVTYTVTVELAG